MSGIAGMISRAPSDHCRSQVQLMLSRIFDEQADGQGFYSDANIGLYVGWKRHRRVIDSGHPLSNERKDCEIILSGEVIPRLSDIAELRRKGHDFSNDDASYLVHLYEETGADFVTRINGLFCGVLVDHRAGQCFLFNDRYGMKRLFIHQSYTGIYFSTLPGALLAVCPITREFDPEGLAEFITSGCTLGERSLFRNISILPGGSFWTAHQGNVTSKRRYFSPKEWEGQDRLEQNDFNERVESLFPLISRRYADPDMPTGISLTGGIDTRMVLACLKLHGATLRCYTFASMYRDTFDVLIARRIAKLCGLHHESIVLGDEFLRGFPTYLENAIIRSGGYLGLSGAASLYVNSQARRIAPIRLTGNFGSEIFRGVRAFKAGPPKVRYYEPTLGPYVDSALCTFRRLLRQDPISFSLFIQAPNQGFGLSSVEESMVIMRTPFLDNELAELMYAGPRSYSAGLALSVSIIEKNNESLLRVPTDFGYLGRGGKLIQTIRKGYDQFLFKGEYWTTRGLPGGASALFLRVPWLSPERFFLGRHKYQHYQIWLKRELSEYVRSLFLADGQLPGCFDKGNLVNMVQKHLSGQLNYLEEVDRAITIILNQKLLLADGGYTNLSYHGIASC